MVSTSAIQKRRDMSISSALGPASAVTISGSSPMPQMGQAPGWSCRIRSEEHTSELQSLMRISYAVFCLKKKTNNNIYNKKKIYKLEQKQYHDIIIEMIIY